MRVVLLLLSVLLLGCQLTQTGPYTPYTPGTAADRDSTRAEELSRAGAELIHEDPERAEALLREALAADLFFGPAHNNLGVLYLEQGKLYEAAGEFEWARKLLPGHPDPRMNLALTLERAGRTEEAVESYRAALEAYPGHIGATQGLASLTLRSGAELPEARELLQEVAIRGTSATWRAWALEQLAGGRRD